MDLGIDQPNINWSEIRRMTMNDPTMVRLAKESSSKVGLIVAKNCQIMTSSVLSIQI